MKCYFLLFERKLYSSALELESSVLDVCVKNLLKVHSNNEIIKLITNFHFSIFFHENFIGNLVVSTSTIFIFSDRGRNCFLLWT